MTKKYSYTTAEDLAQMAATLRTISESIGCTASRRQPFIDTADKIDAFLDGQQPAAKVAMEDAIRSIQADIASEADRHGRLDALYRRLDDARNNDKPGAWRQAMLRTLMLLTHDQIRNLAEIVERFAYTQEPVDVDVLGDQLDAAFDAQDPRAWCDTAVQLLPQLSDDLLLVVMGAMNDALVSQACGAIDTLIEMPAASETRQ